MKKFLFAMVFVFVGFLVFSQEKIAVFPFEDMEKIFTKNEAVLFYRNFTNEFTNRSSGKFSVVPRQEVEKLITIEAGFQLSDFSAKAKTAEMQRVLNGTQILSGVIGRFGNSIHISVSLYTYPELRQLPGGTDMTVSSKDELIKKIPELVQNMQGEIGGKGSSKGSSFLEKGIAYFRSGDYDRAILELTDAIKSDPNLLSAYDYRAASYYNKIQYDGVRTHEQNMADRQRALDDYSQAIRLSPNNDGYYYLRALCHPDDSWELSIADISQAIRLNPKEGYYFWLRGNIYSNRGYSNNSYWDKAIADFSQAIRLNSYEAGAYLSRARVYIYKGDFDKAIADCNLVIELYPNHIDDRSCGEAYQTRGSAWFGKGNTSQCNADYATAAEFGVVGR